MATLAQYEAQSKLLTNLHPNTRQHLHRYLGSRDLLLLQVDVDRRETDRCPHGRVVLDVIADGFWLHLDADCRGADGPTLHYLRGESARLVRLEHVALNPRAETCATDGTHPIDWACTAILRNPFATPVAVELGNAQHLQTWAGAEQHRVVLGDFDSLTSSIHD